MPLTKKEITTTGVKFIFEENGEEIGRAYLYLIKNGLHREPYGLLEDVFVKEDKRGGGLGGELVKAVVAEAKRLGCYKLIGTSRAERASVHAWYKNLGFKDYGKEFRMDL